LTLPPAAFDPLSAEFLADRYPAFARLPPPRAGLLPSRARILGRVALHRRALFPSASPWMSLTPAPYLALFGTVHVLEKLTFFSAAAVLTPNDVIALFVLVYLVTSQVPLPKTL
jgi:hypothetical protein